MRPRVSLLCSLFMFVLIPTLIFADGPQNVPDVAVYEQARRGNHVEQTGTIRSGLMTEALAPPADDSGRWHICLVVKDRDVDSAAMMQTIAHDKAMAPWVNVAEPVKSQTHYQIRRIDDATQRDWLANIRKQLDEKGLPCVIVQPPRNGHFGNHTNIVKMIHGRCSGEYLSGRLRDSIIEYVKKLEEQSNAHPNAISAPPPFNVPPPPVFTPVAPDQPKQPFEFPQLSLTIDQIQAACPGASPQFILDTIASKETNLELVKLRYLVEKSKHQDTPPAVAPDKPIPDECCPVTPDCRPEHGFFDQCHPTQLVAAVAVVSLLIGYLGSGIVKSPRILNALNALRGITPPA